MKSGHEPEAFEESVENGQLERSDAPAEFTIMMHIPNMWSILIIAVLFMVLFGANRLPEAARSLGRASQEFKKGLRDGQEPDNNVPALKE